MNWGIVYKDNNAYKVLDEIFVHNFINSDNSVNQRVLGMYVHYKGGDHVLQRGNKFLICETIEEAVIVEDD